MMRVLEVKRSETFSRYKKNSQKKHPIAKNTAIGFVVAGFKLLKFEQFVQNLKKT